MSDATYGTKIQLTDGGDKIQVASGGSIELDSGADLRHNGISLVDELAALNGLDATELGAINGVTAGTVTASKAVVVDANKDVSALRNVGLAGTLTFEAGGRIDADSGTGTCVTNAVTISKMAGVITTEALTTVAGSSAVIALTNTLIAVGDLVLVWLIGGTNTRKNIMLQAVAISNGATITIFNNEAVAINGTLIVGFMHLKA